MPFSRLRQHLPRSSRNEQEKLAQLTETFPDEDSEKLDQALKDARVITLKLYESPMLRGPKVAPVRCTC